VRNCFERRFTSEQMAEGYLEVYRRLLNAGDRQPQQTGTGKPDMRVVA
jgi:hypothetical protein